MSGCHSPYVLGSVTFTGSTAPEISPSMSYRCNCPCHREVGGIVQCICSCRKEINQSLRDQIQRIENNVIEIKDFIEKLNVLRRTTCPCCSRELCK